MNKFLILFAAVCGLLGAPAAYSQEGYPARPIRILCGFGVGGGTDVIGRVIGQKMTESWGQGVVVDNRTGAGGIIASELLTRAAPDGHTLLIVAMGHAFGAAFYNKLPYDTVKDFAGITTVADVPNVLVVAPALRVKTMRELIEHTRARPAQVNFASAGVSSASYINAELFNLAAAIKPVHVPFKTMPDALTSMLGGNVQFVFSSITAAVPLIRAERLTALAVSTKNRSPALPDVPSMSEAGLADFDFSSWYGLLAPAGTPRAIKHKLSAEVRRIVALPDVKERMLTQGATPRSSTPEEFDTLIRQEVERMVRLIKTVGIQKQ